MMPILIVLFVLGFAAGFWNPWFWLAVAPVGLVLIPYTLFITLSIFIRGRRVKRPPPT